MVGTFATGAILINVLLMQSGSHPAPMFRNAHGASKPVIVTNSLAPVVPRPRPAEFGIRPGATQQAHPSVDASTWGDHQ